jgi:hypothetical protein
MRDDSIALPPRELAVLHMLCSAMANPKVPAMGTAEGVIVEPRYTLRSIRRMKKWPTLRDMGRRSLLKVLKRLQARGLVRLCSVRRARYLVRVLGYPETRPVAISDAGVAL